MSAGRTDPGRGETEPVNAGRRGFFRRLAGAEAAADAAPARHWRPVDGLDAGAGDVFWTVWADAATVLVAGDDGTVLRHRDGGWSRLACPVMLPLHALWGPSPDALVAVGWMGAILTADGDGWRHDRGGRVGADGRYAAVPENRPLFAVTGDATGRLWAVGDGGTILTRPPGCTRPDAWQAEDSGTRMHLRAVTGLGDGRVLAAGADGTVLLRRRDGTWTALDCPVRTGVQAVLALGPDAVLLAGGRYFAADNGFRGDLLRWRDGRFSRLGTDLPLPRLRALAAADGGAVAVGDKGRIFVVRPDGVLPLDSPTRHDLLAIAARPDGGLIAAGDFGTVLAATGATGATGAHDPDPAPPLAAPAVAAGAGRSRWTPVASGTDRQLWGVWQDPRDGALLACGEDGIVLRRDGGGWDRLPPAGDLGLHALGAAPDGGILAAGQLGEIHHFDGARWRRHVDLHVDVTILALWTDGRTVVAVGDEGLILRWDGTDWHRVASGTRAALYGLWGLDDRHMLAVGDFGLVLRWNGDHWDAFHAGTEAFLFDVWGRGLDDIHIVGLSGTLGHFDGRRWTLTPARARADLLAVDGGDAGVVAVGAAGTALAWNGATGVWDADPTGVDAGLRAVVVAADGSVIAVGDGGTILEASPWVRP